MTVVGLGADGWSGLSEATRERVSSATVVLGGHRQLDLLPEVPGQVRETLPSPLRDGLPGLMHKYAGERLVVLASGDPFVSGIGSTLVDLFGNDFAEVIPAVSSVALARARLGWSAELTDVVSTSVGTHTSCCGTSHPGIACWCCPPTRPRPRWWRGSSTRGRTARAG